MGQSSLISAKTMQLAAGIVILAVAAGLVYFGYQRYQAIQTENARMEAENRREAERAAATDMVREAAGSRLRSDRDGSRKPASQTGSSPTNAPSVKSVTTPAGKAPNLRLEMEVLLGSTAAVGYADDALLFDEKLSRGATKMVEADQHVRLIVESPGVVEIKLNGERLTRIDRGRGLVLDARFADGHVSVTTMH